MLIGDALPVAQEIGRSVGLPSILRVADLKAAGAKGAAVGPLGGADGFAEVYPEDKFIVVQRLQTAGAGRHDRRRGERRARVAPG